MEITPELVDLAGIDHLIDNVNCISSLALLAHVIAPEDLIVSHVAHSSEVVDDPFIEVVPPMRERMCQLGFVLAVPEILISI